MLIKVLRLKKSAFIKSLCSLVLLYLATLSAFAEIKDPTRPYKAELLSSSQAEETEQEFTVSTILKKKAFAWAIINGQQVRERDSVGGAKVIKIEARRVLLKVDGEQRWIGLPQAHKLKKRLGE